MSEASLDALELGDRVVPAAEYTVSGDPHAASAGNKDALNIRLGIHGACCSCDRWIGSVHSIDHVTLRWHSPCGVLAALASRAEHNSSLSERCCLSSIKPGCRLGQDLALGPHDVSALSRLEFGGHSSGKEGTREILTMLLRSRAWWLR